MKMKEILIEFDKEFGEGTAATRENMKSFIRTAIENAFEATRVEGGSVQGISSFGGPVDNLDEARGYNQALDEVKQKQEEFLKE